MNSLVSTLIDSSNWTLLSVINHENANIYVLYGRAILIAGVALNLDLACLKAEVPHIIVGTPGRIMDLATKKKVLTCIHAP